MLDNTKTKLRLIRVYEKFVFTQNANVSEQVWNGLEYAYDWWYLCFVYVLFFTTFRQFLYTWLFSCQCMDNCLCILVCRVYQFDYVEPWDMMKLFTKKGGEVGNCSRRRRKSRKQLARVSTELLEIRVKSQRSRFVSFKIRNWYKVKRFSICAVFRAFIHIFFAINGTKSL